MKKMSLCVVAIAVLLASGCATKPAPPVATTTDTEKSGVYSDKEGGYKTTAVMEFYKRTTMSVSHDSGLALAVGSEVSNILRNFRINIAYPSVVTSEFTSRGEIDMVNEGVRVAKVEKKDLVLFLDVQVRKRGKTGEAGRNINVSIDSWAVDARNKKLVLRLSREGSRVMESGARLSDMDQAVRETLIETARDMGEEVGRLLQDYLSAA